MSTNDPRAMPPSDAGVRMGSDTADMLLDRPVIEITQEMIDAGERVIDSALCYGNPYWPVVVRDVFSAMLGAATTHEIHT